MNTSDLLEGNLTTLAEDLKEHLCKWKGTPCAGIEHLTPLRYLYINLHIIPIKMSTEYFQAIDELSLNFIRKKKQVRMVRNSLKEKRNEGGIVLQYSKIYLKYKTIKTRGTGKNKHISWNRL